MRNKIFVKSRSLVWDKYLTNVIKGIAIIMIVVGHAGNRIPEARLLTPLGAIGVGLFLICSGFGLEKSLQINGIANYWKKKLINVWIPFCLIEIIGLFFHPASSLSEIFLDLMLLKPLHPFWWYLQFLAIWYVVFYLASLCKLTGGGKILCLSLVAIPIVCLWNPTQAQNAFSFVIGVALANKEGLLTKISRWYVVLSIIIISIVTSWIRYSGALTNENHLLWNVYSLVYYLSLTMLSLIVIIRCYGILLLKFLATVGTYSYSIYLVHRYTFEAFSSYSLMIILLFFVSTIGFSVAFEYINKQLRKPIKKLFLR